jgi:nucleotide-binding universal stress UspA family protein
VPNELTISSRSTKLTAPRARSKSESLTGLSIRRVLVPIDFSPASSEVLAFVLPLLKKFGAELHLVHVFASDYPLASLVTMPLIVPEIEVSRRVHSHLKDVALQQAIALRRENIHAVKGQPFAQICRLAREIQADLIVTATRGLTGLKHLALGSTAERVVRHAPCPVLVVHAKGGRAKRPSATFKKIVVPVDFSRCSAKGLAYARALAKKFDAKLVLVHSVDLHAYNTNPEYSLYDFPPLLAATEKAAREQMRELVYDTDWKGVKVENSVESGHAGDQVCRRAQEVGADLIVTATHGHTGLKHVLLGSTAEYVVRHAPCPVLVVPSHDRPPLAARGARRS